MKLLDLSQAKKGISNSAKSYLRFSPGVRISRINKISLDFLNKIADSGVMSNKRGAVYIWWVLFSASLIKCSNYGRKISSVYNSHKARHWQKVISMSVLIFNKKTSVSDDWSRCLTCQSNEFARRLQVHAERVTCVCSFRRFQSYIAEKQYKALIIADAAKFNHISPDFDEIRAKDDVLFIFFDGKNVVSPTVGKRLIHLTEADFPGIVNTLRKTGCTSPDARMRALLASFYIKENIDRIRSSADVYEIVHPIPCISR